MRGVAEGAPVAFHLWVFCVGAVLGSFLNVVIARVPRGESVVSPPSRCPRCKAAIRWYDNIPVISWLVLRGKCRSCGVAISPRYPMVELLTAVIAVAVFHQFGATWVAVGLFAFAAALLALAYIDLDTWLLPHRITWPLLAVGLVSPAWNRQFDFRSSLIGAAVGYAGFAAIALLGEKVLKRETMGWGDVWLLAGIGAWMGWQALLPVVMLSALQGAVVGAILLAVGRDPAAHRPAEGAGTPDDDWVPPKHAVPYGPFLSLAALEVLLFGDRLFAAWGQVIRRLAP
jgi:leader peptidase (prepilin peptidase)/N-methyltransferase